ncbi:MAG: thiol-disulfide isomerase [Pseudomonadales bacterium]
MDSLLIAHVALWLLMAGLVMLIAVLSRQVSWLHAQVAPAGALSVNAVLTLGQDAPELQLTTLRGKRLRTGGAGGQNRSLLLLFVAPDCPISRSLTPVLATLARAEPWLDVVLASDGGSREEHLRFSESADLARLDYVLSESLGRAYGISKLPYAVLVDEHGKVVGMGIVNSREHLESLFEAKERGVSSIQEFMIKNELYYDADAPSG